MSNAVKEFTVFPDKTFPINLFFLENPSELIHLHWHPHIEWIFVIRGKARIQIDATFTDVEKGNLIFINPNQIHGATPLENKTKLVAIVSNYSLLRNFYLDSTEARYILPIINQEITLPNLLNSDEPITKDIRTSIFQLINEFNTKKPGYELLIKSKLYHVLGLMVRQSQEIIHKNKLSLNQQDVLSVEFRYFLQYLEENHDKEIRINEAAAMINVSPSHFYRVFKKITGKTLIEYINTLRIYKAESLLGNTQLSIEEIAEKVGFTSATYFGRVFQQYKNYSPSVYRHRQQ
jgi:AraC family transcriptional regulator, transcriptional activator of pobA